MVLISLLLDFARADLGSQTGALVQTFKEDGTLTSRVQRLKWAGVAHPEQVVNVPEALTDSGFNALWALRALGFPKPLDIFARITRSRAEVTGHGVRAMYARLQKLGLTRANDLIAIDPNLLHPSQFARVPDLRQRLSARGITYPVRVIDANPFLIRLPDEQIDALLAAITAAGFRLSVRLVNRDPEVLFYAFDGSLKARLNNLRRLGITQVLRMAERFPYLLDLDTRSIQAAKARHLREDWLTTRGTLTYGPNDAQFFERIGLMFSYLERMRIDVAGIAPELRQTMLARLSVEDVRKPLGDAFSARVLPKILAQIGFDDPAAVLRDRPELTSFTLIEILKHFKAIHQYGLVEINDSTRVPTLAGAALRERNELFARLRRQGFLDPERLVKALPELKTTPEGDVDLAVRELVALGLRDVTGLVDRHPDLLTYALDGSLAARFEGLRAFGLRDSAGMVTTMPYLLDRQLTTLEWARARHLREDWGLDRDSFANPKDSIIRFERSWRMSEHLRAFGVEPASLPEDFRTFCLKMLDVDKLDVPLKRLYTKDDRARRLARMMERMGFTEPERMLSWSLTLELSITQILARLRRLESFGVADARRLVTRSPVLLTMAQETLDSRVNALRGAGFATPGALLEQMPELAQYDLVRTLPETMEVLVAGWGLSSDEIAKRPFLIKSSVHRNADLLSYLSSMSIDTRALPMQMKVQLIRSYDREKTEAVLVKAGFVTSESQRAALRVHLYGVGLFMKYDMCERALGGSSEAAE